MREIITVWEGADVYYNRSIALGCLSRLRSSIVNSVLGITKPRFVFALKMVVKNIFGGMLQLLQTH